MFRSMTEGGRGAAAKVRQVTKLDGEFPAGHRTALLPQLVEGLLQRAGCANMGVTCRAGHASKVVNCARLCRTCSLEAFLRGRLAWRRPSTWPLVTLAAEPRCSGMVGAIPVQVMSLVRRTIREHVSFEGIPGHIRKLYFSRRAFLWAVSSEMRGHDQQMTPTEAPSPCRSPRPQQVVWRCRQTVASPYPALSNRD